MPELEAIVPDLLRGVSPTLFRATALSELQQIQAALAGGRFVHIRDALPPAMAEELWRALVVAQGEGRFERIGWDEALDEIAERGVGHGRFLAECGSKSQQR